MMYKFEISLNNNKVIIFEQDGWRNSFIDPSPGNVEYEKYLEWVAEGNTAEKITVE